ncbi:DNA cytosine methyltransferase [Campylobacter vicugnae]|uniref:DNA cytosine methyltransferase n=1 Tax=Campylobacter vicugnae TaxID=1660076 RepID=UPI00191C7F3F|nr:MULTISPECIES: DNA cytosine methyltransferase [unclassified Campylobacter]
MELNLFSSVILENRKESEFIKKDFTFIDLFAGIGGIRMGIQKAGGRCVFSSEIDLKAAKVYKENFLENPLGDVTQINPQQLPSFDLLSAGFPCQPFSISGKKRGFEDTRGTLFFDICRIIDEKKPKVVLLENVKHLMHHDKGNTLKVILRNLIDLGYNVNYKLLNAKDFGVPQNRERIIIVASKKDNFDFGLINKSIATQLRDYLDIDGEFEILSKNDYTLLDNIREQESGLIFCGYRNKNIWKKGIRENTLHLSRVHRQPNRIYSIDGIHPTIPSQESSGRFFIYIPEKDIVRKLTINECYRIMGFPNDFIKDKSLSESYKQIGNSVCVNMIESIAKEIVMQGLLDD